MGLACDKVESESGEKQPDFSSVDPDCQRVLKDSKRHAKWWSIMKRKDERSAPDIVV